MLLQVNKSISYKMTSSEFTNNIPSLEVQSNSGTIRLQNNDT